MHRPDAAQSHARCASLAQSHLAAHSPRPKKFLVLIAPSQPQVQRSALPTACLTNTLSPRLPAQLATTIPQRRQPQHPKSTSTLSHSRIARDSLEIFRHKVKREAPIARRMLMAHFKIVPGISQQQRTRRHQFVADSTVSRSSILKRSRQHHRDRNIAVPLFKNRILRARRANQVLHCPAIATREYATGRMTGRAARRSAPRQSLLQFDRNFCQDAAPAPA